MAKKMSVGSVYYWFEQIAPPVIFRQLKRTGIYRLMRRGARQVLPSEHNPVWHEVSAGVLKGRKLFLDNSQQWIKHMLSGDYESNFQDYIAKIDLRGKVIFDIGAHIGFQSLYFAQLAGLQGQVLAFEPNPVNVTRMKKILGANGDLAERISLFNYAVAEHTGTIMLSMSEAVDDGSSCGGFVEGAHTIWEKGVYYEKCGFQEVAVKAIALDDIRTITGSGIKPDLVKIDVEGAEHLVLQGAQRLIKETKPILLIELHSIRSAMESTRLISSLGYRILLLDQQPSGICLIACEPGGSV